MENNCSEVPTLVILGIKIFKPPNNSSKDIETYYIHIFGSFKNINEGHCRWVIYYSISTIGNK